MSLAIELAASLLTLTGIYLGSTTFAGANCYAASLIFWFWMMVRVPLWGLLPLNLATAVITAINLARAW